MSKFITGKELENAIYDIIWDAKETLLIVSPFIKLDDYFKKLFDHHVNNHKFHLLLIFGKNEKDVRKSMKKEDFEYFKKFLNVSIIHVPKLHAKYFGNENKGIVTSINLYDYSFKNNIEFGIYSEQSIINKFSPSFDNAAWEECMNIANEGDVVFIKRPVFEHKKLLINLGKSYVKSDIVHDSTEMFYGFKKNLQTNKKLTDFPDSLELGSKQSSRPEREEEKKEVKYKKNTGYCIRTGVEIPFNPKAPLCKSAWEVWSQYGDPDFEEKFCHSTGKKSYGKTSMRNPIMGDRW